MQTRTVEKAQATAGTAMARSQNHQEEAYQNPQEWSSLLTQAAEVLCLLTFSPLSAMEQRGFVALLDRRLRRAYAGAER